MKLFVRKLERLVQSVESDPDEFARLVSKHGLEGYSGVSDVLFSHALHESAIPLRCHDVKWGGFKVIVENHSGCYDCDNAFEADQLLKAA